MLSDSILHFLFNLSFDVPLPSGFAVLHPFLDKTTRDICGQFYTKYYNDNNKRFCIIGINPGRFGAGITGIPFTDPIRLETKLKIDNPWLKKQELSSVFVYDVISAFGGAEKFYSNFYITAVCPLGLTKNGNNINYYDDKILQKTIQPFVMDCLHKQLQWMHSSVAFCLGEGKNYLYLKNLNDKFNFFNKIIALPHPRFVMQYKLRQKEMYISRYLETFHSSVS